MTGLSAQLCKTVSPPEKELPLCPVGAPSPLPPQSLGRLRRFKLHQTANCMESMEACSMAVPLNLRFSQVDKGGGHNYIGPPGGWR